MAQGNLLTMDKQPKDAKDKDTGKTKDAVKHLQAEMLELQTLVAGLTRETRSGDAANLPAAPVGDVSDEAVAALGAAFASAQKVALLRALDNGGEATAASLGEAAHLSTGSLYHHLRDLTHARLVAQTDRTRYALTPRGVKVLHTLLALAAES